MGRLLPLAAALIGILALLVLFVPLLRDAGLAKGNDTLLHVGNVVECAYILTDRLPPLDWLPDIAGGRGGPNFIYYGSLGFLGPAILVNLGLGPVDSIRIWIALTILVGFAAGFLWCSQFGGWKGGIAGGVLFVFGPYYFSLPYARGSYPEHQAYSLYPLVFFFAHRSATAAGWGAVAGLAITLFLVVAIHTLSLLIVLPFVAVYSLIAAGIQGSRSPLWRCAAALGLGAVLLAPCLVAPLFEKDKVALGEQFMLPEAERLYATIGVPWHSLFNKETLDDIVSRCVPGRVHLLALAAAFLSACVLTERRARRFAYSVIALSVVALLLVEETAGAISVKAFPLLAYLQFPWRFLGIFNLFCAAAFASCFSKDSSLSEGRKLFAMAVAPILCAAVYFGNLPAMEVVHFKTDDRGNLRFSMTTLDHENKYMPAGAVLPAEPAPKLLLEVRDGEAWESRVLPNDFSYQVNLKSPQRVKFHQYWFEGWKAEVDGQAVPIEKEKALGVCLVEVPAGSHDIRFHFSRTPRHAAALAVSAGGWLALSVAAILGLVRRLGGRSLRGKAPDEPRDPLGCRD